MSPAHILLFLALTANLTGRVHCQEEEGEPEPDPDPEQAEDTSETSATEETLAEGTPSEGTDLASENVDDPLDESSGSGISQVEGVDIGDDGALPTEDPSEELSPIIIIIPLVAVLVIIGMVVGAVMISRRLRSKSASSDPVQPDAYLDACEGEKVPMPMFEDDVPSVLELEMEDLEKWMVKDGGGSNLNSGPV